MTQLSPDTVSCSQGVTAAAMAGIDPTPASHWRTTGILRHLHSVIVLSLIAVSLLTFGGLAGVGSAEAKTLPFATTQPFVTVCGLQLCNGSPFIAKGATAYGQYGNPVGEVALARQAGVNVLELVEFDTRYHTLSDTMSTATWTRVDAFIAAVASAGLHVILNLSEYGQSLAAASQTPTTVDWNTYLSFIANRVNTVTGVTYKSDPTIAMVELYGEIEAPGYHVTTRGTTAQMNAFFRRTLAEWRALAPNILVSTGGFSYINDPNSGIDWKTIVADPNDATCNVEINSFPDRNISVPNMSSFCNGLNKPWFLAAWSSCWRATPRFNGDADSWPTDAAMAAHAQDMYNVSGDHNPTAPAPAMAAIGSDFWNLANKPSRQGMCDIGTQFPLTLKTVQSTP
jgi:hypothetical protein